MRPNLIDQLRAVLQGDALAQLESAAEVIRAEPGTSRAIVAGSVIHALHRQYRYEEFRKQFAPKDKREKSSS